MQVSLPLTKSALFALVAATFVACGGGLDGNRMAGNQKLRAGISLARTGIQQYHAGDTEQGLRAVDQGRGMMGQGMMMMGLDHCFLPDGGSYDASAMTACASMMGQGPGMMMQGLAGFDAARPMMTDPDLATADRAMADMETAMQMMEQGATQMMGMSGPMAGSGMM